MDPYFGQMLLPSADLAFVTSSLQKCWSQFRGKRIFITGGTGFVGRWIVGSLLHANSALDLECEVVVLSRNPLRFLGEFPDLAGVESLRFVDGNVRGFEFPTGRFDIVIHGATDVLKQPPKIPLLDDCYLGTRRVLDFSLACSAETVFLLSSGAVYGKSEREFQTFSESTHSRLDTLSVSSSYGEGKRVSELLCACYADEYGFDLKIARLFAFVGPHLALDGPFAIGNFVRDALAKTDVVIRGDGTPVRSYLDSKDMTVWLLSILAEGKSGDVFNVGGAQAISIFELANLVVQIAQSTAKVRVLSDRSSNNPEWYVPDVSKVKTQLSVGESESLSSSISNYIDWHNRIRRI
jgi:nucleoside-diphosphate-sugar epimerase